MRFDSETHTYWLGNVRLPSVTEIIAPLCDYGGIPHSILERKRLLGTEFHRAIEYWFTGELDIESIDPAIEKPFEAFRRWAAHNAYEGVEAERVVYSKDLLFAGTPDIICGDNLFDIKLRVYKPETDILQLVGYEMLINRGRLNKFIVSFDNHGGYKQRRAEHPQARGVYLKLVDYHYGRVSKEEMTEIITNWGRAVKK